MGQPIRFRGGSAALGVALGLALLAPAHPAEAVPVPTEARLTLEIRGIGAITVTGAGVVDIVGSTIQVPAGLVSLASPLTVPVTGTSAVAALSVTGISNLAATFSANGVAAQSPAELCPPAGPAPGFACNRPVPNSSVGGAMALTGTLQVRVLRNAVIPLRLGPLRVGQGGTGTSPFTTEAALWTQGYGLVNTGANTLSTRGGLGTATPFTLVTPTYVEALGNQLPIFAAFTLTNLRTPEPGALLLLATGMVGAWLFGRGGSR